MNLYKLPDKFIFAEANINKRPNDLWAAKRLPLKNKRSDEARDFDTNFNLFSMTEAWLKITIEDLISKGELPEWAANEEIIINISEVPAHTNPDNLKFHLTTIIGFTIAKKMKKNPLEIAQLIADKFVKNYIRFIAFVTKPGFININFGPETTIRSLTDFMQFNSFLNFSGDYGNKNRDFILNNEFVSVNPTGFLHWGHIRGAVYADSVSRLYKMLDYSVVNEYWINDAGNQINIFAHSIYYRYLQEFFSQEEVDKIMPFPEEGYKGRDIILFAKELAEKYGNKFLSDHQSYNNQKFKNICVDFAMREIKNDLLKINIKHDIFTSERSIIAASETVDTFKNIEKHTYKKDGALFLNTTANGDDKDRVLIKSDGEYTYFYPDIAYQYSKTRRSNRLLSFWGADHSGYIKRMTTALTYLGWKPEDFVVEIVQMVRLVQNGEEYKMSKRAGTGLFLRDILESIDSNTIRWFMTSRDVSSKLDFEIEDLKRIPGRENLVQVLKEYENLENLFFSFNGQNEALYDAFGYVETKDYDGQYDDLIMQINLFKKTVEVATDGNKVNLITHYLLNLMQEFKKYQFTITPDSYKSVNAKNNLDWFVQLSVLTAMYKVTSYALWILGITPNGGVKDNSEIAAWERFLNGQNSFDKSNLQNTIKWHKEIIQKMMPESLESMEQGYEQFVGEMRSTYQSDEILKSLLIGMGIDPETQFNSEEEVDEAIITRYFEMNNITDPDEQNAIREEFKNMEQMHMHDGDENCDSCSFEDDFEDEDDDFDEDFDNYEDDEDDDWDEDDEDFDESGEDEEYYEDEEEEE